MLRVVAQASRRKSFAALGDIKQRHLPVLNAHFSVRSFWGFSKGDGDDSNNGSNKNPPDDEKGDIIDESISTKPKGIVSPFGDNSPTISPLIILPTNRRPVFPGYLSAVTVKDEATIEAIVNNNFPSYVGVFLRQESSKMSLDHKSDIITDISELHNVGTFAQIQQMFRAEGGTQLILMGHRRINLSTVNSYGPPTIAEVKHWQKPIVKANSTSIKAHTNEVLSLARELIKMNPLLQEQLQLHQWASRVDFNDPYRLADFATALTTAEGWELQKVLEAVDIEERLLIVLELLAKERELSKIQKEINRQVEEKVSKQQREYFLREQLKSIKKELGMEKDDKEDMLSKYSEQLAKLSPNSLHETTLKVIKEEMKKLESLEKNSPEFNVTRSYLDWLFSIPWDTKTKDVLNLEQAKAVLDEDHYGLEEIKKRILEFIAVGKLKGSVNGKIICFIGPPGVGKTSIAKSISRALDREFYRFSVGGLMDTAEIKGHRRTYIGAMPGKPIQCLKTTKCMNPLILIDEIDKLGKSYNGDPASALLELLDPNQNSNFIDHYLDVPVDFSNVLFVCTANDESTIPGPLKDRMEVIRLSGYDTKEKIAIASKYLVPKALKESGLVPDAKAASAEGPVEPLIRYEITEDALEVLIKNYCRESGVRSLEKAIDKIARKLAYLRVGAAEANRSENTDETVRLTKEDVEKYAGKPIFVDDTIYENKGGPLPPGIVMGLAWNPLGGSPIFIETVAVPCSYSERDSGVNMVTGQLGSVMRESVNIAYTFARKFTMERDRDSKFFNSHQIHLHVPEGAISKDGPSAGIAMATSFISVAMNRPLRSNVAMTGELSLTGKVLPVGGIKEKTLAAKRSGAKIVVLPFANKRDFDELPDYVKEDISAHFVKEYKEVYQIVFPTDEQ